MCPTQIVEQARLVLFGEQVVRAGLVDAGALQLLEQRRGRHLQFAGKLGHAHLVHC
jgi:hypothetical protein